MKRTRWLAGVIAVLAGAMSANAQTPDAEPAKSLVMVRLLTSPNSGQDPDAIREEGASCPGGLVLGASFYWMRPFTENNAAYRTNVGLGGLSPQTDTTNFRWNMVPGFAIWGGYTLGDGLGVRGRWFHLDGQSNT